MTALPLVTDTTPITRAELDYLEPETILAVAHAKDEKIVNSTSGFTYLSASQ